MFDREQALSILGVSANVSFGRSASGRASLCQSVKLNQSSKQVVAKVNLVLDGQQWVSHTPSHGGSQEVRLVPDALAFLTTPKGRTMEERLAAFFRACGDFYVSAVHMGAWLNVFFSLEKNEAQPKQL